MKYGMMILSLEESYPRDIQSLTTICKKMSLDGVEIWLPSLTSLSWQYIKNIKDVLDESELEVSMLTLTTDFVHPDQDVWQWNKSYLKIAAELAKRFETRIIRVTLHQHPALSLQKALVNAKARMREALQIAEDEDVVLALENHPGDIENRKTVLQEMFATFDTERLRLNYDPANAFIVNEDPVSTLRELIGKVVHIHAKNCYVMEEGKFVAEPSDIWKGNTDYRALMSILNEAGYDGFFSLQFAGKTPEQSLKRSVKYLREIERSLLSNSSLR